MLRYLAGLLIVPGKRVTVKSRAPFDGPLVLSVGRHELSIGQALAMHILVAPTRERAGKRSQG
jgi:Fe2+ transport system protein FeoA